ncbi:MULTISPECIES: YkvA family protein [unclassified Aureispira]|uniref:YkvA family protein n=1 Tax=unclassified Aureispira TaxID=2649989 RepID=UPI000695B5C7|nr:MULTISPECIES: YkvA family protein [unclassified Aureispira]WMX16896.1 YkvA family protein [Aureispira sp. CCB-E]
MKKKKFAKKGRKNAKQNYTTYDDGRKVSKSWFFRVFLRRAYRLLRKPLTIYTLLKQSIIYLERYDSVREFADETKERLVLLTRMIRAYVKGDYQGISKKNVALSLAAILYFLSPIDLIPDFLIAGFLDDLALLTWLYNNLKQELEAFQSWEESKRLIRIPIKVIEEEQK